MRKLTFSARLGFDVASRLFEGVCRLHIEKCKAHLEYEDNLFLVNLWSGLPERQRRIPEDSTLMNILIDILSFFSWRYNPHRGLYFTTL